MKVKDLLDTDFVNFHLPSMYIASCSCTWKCCIEAGIPITVCHNNPTAKMPDIEISADEILRRYVSNPITKAVVIAGLEPMLQIDEVLEVIKTFRESDCEAFFVIFTGYYPNEIATELQKLSQYRNIIVKFGRYVPNQESRRDPVLGVELASPNQWAERIS